MSRRPIPFVGCKAIFRQLGIIRFHHPVSGDLCHNACCGNGNAPGISLDNGHLRNRHTRNRYRIIQKKLRLVYEPLHLVVLTDEKWLLFVIEQVLSNALKYTPEGSVTIFAEAPGTLCIRDTGIGIEAADLPRIFETGFTGCNGRLDKRATGIGLGLSRRILERLGHRIAVESTPGQGTTVRLYLDREPLEVE